MSSDHRKQQSRAGEQRSASSGGSLLGTLITLAAIPVSWIASTLAALIVVAHYFFPDAPIAIISGIGPTTTFYASVGVLIVVGGAILVTPTAIIGGWMVMGILVALAATFYIGWTTIIAALEVMTVLLLIPAFVVASVVTNESGSGTGNGGGSRGGGGSGSSGFKKGILTGFVLGRWWR